MSRRLRQRREAIESSTSPCTQTTMKRIGRMQITTAWPCTGRLRAPTNRYQPTRLLRYDLMQASMGHDPRPGIQLVTPPTFCGILTWTT